MQISSRFTLAVHIFTCIDTFQNEYKVTSDFYCGQYQCKSGDHPQDPSAAEGCRSGAGCQGEPAELPLPDRYQKS